MPRSSSITAVIVNYATPKLTRRSVWSLRSLYPELPILVVDNGSPDDSAERLRKLASDVQPFELLEVGENLHHGPGMDRALRQIDTAWALLFDSDCLAYRRGFLEAMLARAQDQDAYMVGQLLAVDEHGYVSGDVAYPYVHPKCALLRQATYHTLPPFEKHGVPCLTNERAAGKEGHLLLGFPVDDYVFHLSRGTAGRHGYRLGLSGKLAHVKHLLRRAIQR